jgi:cysteine-rich repeat protein
MQRETHIFAAAACAAMIAACSLSTKGHFYPAEDGAADPDGQDLEIDVISEDVVGDDGVEIEIPPGCGDGEVNGAEECDDGNDAVGDGCEPDCTFTCHGDAECTDGDPCNGDETCSTDTHTCEAGGAREDGFVCENDPRSICLGGVCTVSACGDGFVDEGGGEFCEPALDERCSDECTYACTTDTDCPDDEEECNGREVCDTSTMTCSRRDAPAEGSPCDLEAPARKICIEETCQESLCGDEFVDAGAEPPEECDDGNDVDGDGCDGDCAYSCHVHADCDDGEVCNGSETCNGGTHTCVAGANAAAGTGCDDGLFCTEEDQCDGGGNCVGSGDICDDHLDCTADGCDESSDACSNVLQSGFCLISGACYGQGAPNPANECQACRTSLSTTAWANRDDMTPCSSGGGICCAGACRTGGECCASTDCPMACSGLAAPCSDFSSQTACEGQAGCRWRTSVAGCTGTLSCSSIDGVPVNTCLPICGCSGQGCFGPPMVCNCSGSSSRTCPYFSNQYDCEICGCAWGTGTTECTGVPERCGTFATEVECLGQQGCGWTQQVCDPFSYVCL